MPKSDQGFSSERFQVIPRSLIFILNAQGEVLLLKGAENKKIWAGHYNGIGGHIEAGEDIQSSASRELLEETGISDAALYLCGQVMVEVDAQRGIALFIFKGQYEGENLRASEEGGLEWVQLADLPNLPVVEDLLTLLPMVATHEVGDPLIIGKYQYVDDKLKMSFV